ncbi:MAG TPA: hypothetical protein VHC90_12185 [Bryobacteraceae bacterium]|nr:hypothetical protein [Bryobacteraceae bacterium]
MNSQFRDIEDPADVAFAVQDADDAEDARFSNKVDTDTLKSRDRPGSQGLQAGSPVR